MMRLQPREFQSNRPRRGLVSQRLIGLVVIAAVAGVLSVPFIRHSRQVRRLEKPQVRIYALRGTIQKLEPEQKSIVISHEAVPSYMEAMTMPFKLQRPEEMKGLRAGDQISFRLSVAETESWIDRIVVLGHTNVVHAVESSEPAVAERSAASHHPLLDYCFTNELGQAVTLHSFQGQALAITFFFTRCPIPDFCPRLSRNFAEASHQLSSMEHAPTNWHFLSVSFDPAFDTPAVLKAYGQKYDYDPTHWSFLTGPKDKIAELARLSNVEYAPDSGLFSHNFRTMIIDASGRLQMVFPIGGDLSAEIVSEMLKAAAGNHKPS